MQTKDSNIRELKVPDRNISECSLLKVSWSLWEHS